MTDKTDEARKAALEALNDCQELPQHLHTHVKTIRAALRPSPNELPDVDDLPRPEPVVGVVSDMDPQVRLYMMVEDDGDVVLSLYDKGIGRRIEFDANTAQGGTRNRLRKPLLALMHAIAKIKGGE